jgi:hypothetical protein
MWNFLKLDKHYEKKGVLQLALQLNFWVAKDICNSLYLYTWVLIDNLHELQSCNWPYIWHDSLQLNYNFVKTTHFQLLCDSIITTPMMSC